MRSNACQVWQKFAEAGLPGLVVKPTGSAYMSGLGPTATSGHVKQRQRQRRRLHDSHCGVMRCQVWRKNLRRPACWSRRMQSQRLGLLILSGLVLYGLILSAWPVKSVELRTGAWLRVHRGCDCIGAASTSVRHRRQRQRRRGPGLSTSSVCVFVEAVWVWRLYVFVEAVWLWYLWCVYLWSVVFVDSVVGGLVCGCWIGAEMCGSRSLVSSESMSVLCMVGA